MIPTMVGYHITDVLEPDTCLPTQFAALQQSGQLSGELRLLYAILCDALSCLKKNTSLREKREYRAAKEWVEAHEIDHPASFESICVALHLHADAVRAKIARDTFRTGSLKIRCQVTSRLRGYKQRGFKLREAVRP